jgi:hypothetical protein
MEICLLHRLRDAFQCPLLPLAGAQAGGLRQLDGGPVGPFSHQQTIIEKKLVHEGPSFDVALKGRSTFEIFGTDRRGDLQQAFGLGARMLDRHQQLLPRGERGEEDANQRFEFQGRRHGWRRKPALQRVPA